MIPEWQIEGYERLRTELVKLSVNDLKNALRKSDRLGVVCDEQRKMERWFLSRWGQMLTGDNGEYIIEKCKETYKTRQSKIGKTNIPTEVQRSIYEEYKSGVSYKTLCKKYHISTKTFYIVLRRWQG